MKAFTSLASRICMPSSATSSLIATTRAFGTKSLKPPVRVAVTGAAGQIGYALIFRIASGQLLGPDQPVILHLLELPHAMNSLKGVVMELNDCAFPLVHGIVPTEDLATGFKDVNYALLVGAKPRGKGMERKDLLKDNAAIFSAQGKAINSHASRDIKVLVVGNPANTNALIAAKNAPTIPPTQFSAMTRLDHNRGLAQLSEKLNTPVTSIQKFAIWGNHSATQYPDVSHTLVNGKSAKQLINDEKWIRDTFIPTVQQRGAAIINARGSSSAASAASAAIDHIRDWALGKGDKDWTSMAVWSESNYGIQPELYFSYPVTLEGNGKYKVVQGVTHDEYSQQKIKATEKELLEERDAVKEYFK